MHKRPRNIPKKYTGFFPQGERDQIVISADLKPSISAFVKLKTDDAHMRWSMYESSYPRYSKSEYMKRHLAISRPASSMGTDQTRTSPSPAASPSPKHQDAPRSQSSLSYFRSKAESPTSMDNDQSDFREKNNRSAAGWKSSYADMFNNETGNCRTASRASSSLAMREMHWDQVKKTHTFVSGMDEYLRQSSTFLNNGTTRSNETLIPGYGGFISQTAPTIIPPRPITKMKLRDNFPHNIPGYTGHVPKSAMNMPLPKLPNPLSTYHDEYKSPTKTPLGGRAGGSAVPTAAGALRIPPNRSTQSQRE